MVKRSIYSYQVGIAFLDDTPDVSKDNLFFFNRDNFNASLGTNYYVDV